ncbi:MAG: hypothetical protein IKQ29_01655 [Bacilli bacterium]|nr:hypothetical protein [Bacilli bacterium]
MGVIRMGNTNYNIDVKFQDAKDKANAMAQEITVMKNILNALDEQLNGMTWSGQQAADFKKRITDAKAELDSVYTNYVQKIPEQAEISIRKYQNEEQKV